MDKREHEHYRRGELLPVIHTVDGRRIVGWPGTWQYEITSAIPRHHRSHR